jgi:5-methylcytosine-specific restriction endonuclease McrA
MKSSTRSRSITRAQRLKIFSHSRWLCWYCGGEIALGLLAIYVGRVGAVDHQIPRAWGGSSDLKNLVASCTPCNQRKGALSVEAFREKLLHQDHLCCVVFFGEAHQYQGLPCTGKPRSGYPCSLIQKDSTP